MLPLISIYSKTFTVCIHFSATAKQPHILAAKPFRQCLQYVARKHQEPHFLPLTRLLLPGIKSPLNMVGFIMPSKCAHDLAVPPQRSKTRASLSPSQLLSPPPRQRTAQLLQHCKGSLRAATPVGFPPASELVKGHEPSRRKQSGPRRTHQTTDKPVIPA